MKKTEICSQKKTTVSVCVIASGSYGNCIFVSDDKTSILFDAGLSGIEIEKRMKSRDIHPENIDAIVVSHEHSDHIKGVGILSRRYKIPVYISSKTYESASLKLGKIDSIINFCCGSDFKINGFHIHSFPISHDAVDPSGFTIIRNGIKIAIATDLGRVTNVVKEHLKGSAVLILEANHDPDMLINGPYPWSLKQRVKGRCGHLSNFESRDLLMELEHKELSYVFLAHLSKKNNSRKKAFETVGAALSGKNVSLFVADQDKCSQMIKL